MNGTQPPSTLSLLKRRSRLYFGTSDGGKEVHAHLFRLAIGDDAAELWFAIDPIDTHEPSVEQTIDFAQVRYVQLHDGPMIRQLREWLDRHGMSWTDLSLVASSRDRMHRFKCLDWDGFQFDVALDATTQSKRRS